MATSVMRGSSFDMGRFLSIGVAETARFARNFPKEKRVPIGIESRESSAGQTLKTREK